MSIHTGGQLYNTPKNITISIKPKLSCEYNLFIIIIIVVIVVVVDVIIVVVVVVVVVIVIIASKFWIGPLVSFTLFSLAYVATAIWIIIDWQW